MKKIIVNIITISLVLLTTVGFSAWYIIYQIVLNPEKSIGSISKYYELVQEVVYNGQEQVPIQKQGVQLDFDPATLTYSFKLPNEKNYTNGKPVNANVYDVLITATDGRTCKIKFTIKPIEVRLDPPLIELNYVANQYRQWNDMKTKIETMIKFKDMNTNDVINVPYNIDNMTNGIQTYNNSTGQAFVHGSYYHINISLTNQNYKLIGNAYVKFMYKTVKVGNEYFTIEEALKKPTAEIILAGDASSVNTFVVTSFSKLLPETTYDINNIKILLPFDNGRKDPYLATWKTDSWLGQNENPDLITLTNIYAGLYIPAGITVNLNGTTNLIISSVVKFGGEVKRRSVVMNDGVINVNSGAKLLSYGFTKGKGIINVNSGGEVKDVFRINDWPGGDEAIKLKNNLAFPVLKWSVHNITCDTKIYMNGRYNAITFIVVSNGIFRLHVDNIFIVGDSSTPNCLFKPDSGTSTNYVLKKTLIPNDNWMVDNQVLTYHNQIIINGSYIDRPLKIEAAKYAFETSTSIAVPISNYDFILSNNSKLTLSSSSYILYENSKFIVEKDATLDVLGTAYLYSLNSSKITINGKLAGSGYVATKDATGQFANGNAIDTLSQSAEISLTNFTVASCVIKTSPTAWVTINGSADGYINGPSNAAPLVSGTAYISVGNNPFYFVPATSVNKYHIDLNVNGTIKTITYQSIENQYTVSSVTLEKESLIHYEFVGWFIDASLQTPFAEHKFTTDGERITLYAKFKPRVYTFEYNIYYNDGTNVSPIKATLTNQNNSFTIDDFVADKLNITTTASYQGKFFDGWYFGINKTDAPLRITEIHKKMIEEYLKIVGINSSIIPLYCEFSDVISYEVVFIDNHPNENILPGTFTTDVIDVTTQNDVLLSYHDNRDYPEYFIGWFTKSGVEFISNQSSISKYAENNRLVLNARWEKKNIVTINHRSIGAKATNKYAMNGQSIDLTTCKYNDPFLYFANAYDASGSKLSNNTQKINSAVTFELEYAVIVNIKHSGKGAVDVKYNGTSLGNSGSHLVIIGSTLDIVIGGYLFNRGVCEISWCNQKPKKFDGQDYGTKKHYCLITYTVPTTQ